MTKRDYGEMRAGRVQTHGIPGSQTDTCRPAAPSRRSGLGAEAALEVSQPPLSAGNSPLKIKVNQGTPQNFCRPVHFPTSNFRKPIHYNTLQVPEDPKPSKPIKAKQ